MAPVDNHRFCGQLAPARWTVCGPLKNHENVRRILLCARPEGLYNFPTSENGYHSKETSGDPGETPGGPKANSGVSERAPKELRATSIPEGAAAGSAEGNLGARRRTLWALGATPKGPRRDSEGLVEVTPRGIWRRTPGTAGATPWFWRQHRGWRWGTGQPGLRRVSWTGGGQMSARIADCPGGPARRGNRRVALIGPGEAPASHTCGGLVLLLWFLRCCRCYGGLAGPAGAVAGVQTATGCAHPVTVRLMASDNDIDAGGVGTPELTSPGPFPGVPLAVRR
jgi:hypothetical protein